MLLLFEDDVILSLALGRLRGSYRAASGPVVKWSGMERSQFWAAKSGAESQREANLIIDNLNAEPIRENSAIFESELLQSVARRQFPYLNG